MRPHSTLMVVQRTLKGFLNELSLCDNRLKKKKKLYFGSSKPFQDHVVWDKIKPKVK